MANNENGTLYVGVTNDLSRRIWEHKNGRADSFTRKYRVNRLVYYETYTDVRDAIAREKAMKKWNRKWKLNRINAANPDWNDLYEELV